MENSDPICHEYAARIVARIKEAVTVAFRPVACGEWAPQPNDCHNNVNAWVKTNPYLTAVRGWVIDSNCTLAAHSVVRDADGQLFDITPFRDERLIRRFIEHPGDEPSFREVTKGMSQIIYDTTDPNELAEQLATFGVYSQGEAEEGQFE
jgi:hypothetical protein